MENINKFKTKCLVLSETEKAVKAALVVKIEKDGVVIGYYERFIWIPKSVIDENGEIKDWYWNKYYDENERYYKKSWNNVFFKIPTADGTFYINGNEYKFKNAYGWYKI